MLGWHKRLREERGQTMAEYGLILSLVVVGTMAALTFIGVSITGFLSSIAGQI